MAARSRSARLDPHAAGSRERAITSAIEQWFALNARELPWRAPAGTRSRRERWRRDPYWSLVSEAMLQQTQVSRVVDSFKAFIDKFPKVESLAAASEHEVLAMWAGLGYYRRARNLHAAAKIIVDTLGGAFPRSIEGLRELPGVGAYTAGAIASMAGGVRAPLVDGNVVRVLLRVEGRAGRVGEKRTLDWAWSRATELVEQCSDAGVFNEGLMELGATVCVPGKPRCAECPAAMWCVSRATGKQESIPAPKQPAKKQAVCCDCVLLIDDRGRLVVEQRGEEGMWSKMWQTPTLERGARHASRAAVRSHAEEFCESGVSLSLRLVGEFEHKTSHRNLSFRVWRPVRAVTAARGTGRRIVRLETALSMPISNAQRRVLNYARRSPD